MQKKKESYISPSTWYTENDIRWGHCLNQNAFDFVRGSNFEHVRIPDYYSAMSYSRCVLYNERSSDVTRKIVWEELIGRLIREKSFRIQLYLIYHWMMNIPIN